MLLFSNGIIHTVDPSLPNPEAVLVGDDGRISAVGTRARRECSRLNQAQVEAQPLSKQLLAATGYGSGGGPRPDAW